MTRFVVGGLASVLACAACGPGDGVPIFVVDARWSQVLEEPDVLAPVSGMTVAPDGNILIVTRADSSTQAVLEYAPDGSLVREWGSPDNGYPWPERPHGIGVDPDGHVWIGGGTTHILKLSRSGDHIMTIGEVGGDPDSNSRNSFGGATDFAFDAAQNEVYVADGRANRRVVVLDLSTGEFKRSWGAYGDAPQDGPPEPSSPPGPASRQFATVSCVTIADDLVYVCDRENDRIQVFGKDGRFVTEATVAPGDLGRGSVFDLAASPDEDFLYVADGANGRVHILEREGLTLRTSFGVGGGDSGSVGELGSVAVDAAGNIYAARNGQSRRIRKFAYQGVGPVPVEPEGASP